MRRWGIGIILAGLLAMSASGFAPAARAADSHGAGPAITISGNRHVGADMIRSYFHPAPDGNLDATALDAGLKRLYATGLFKDVKISRAGDRILVKVIENPTIGIVSFEGNKKVKDADLKKAIQSKANGPLSRELVQGDVVNIIALYRQHGYYDVHVVPETIATRASGGNTASSSARLDRVNLVFDIKEGDKLAVRQIRFVGNAAFSTTKLKAAVKTGTTNLLSFLLDNDIYDADRIESDRDLLRRFYRDHGYADVEVSSTAGYDAAQKGVVLTFKVDEGPQYRLGKVKIESVVSGADPAVVRGALRMQAGDVYDADAVHKSVEDMTMALAKSGQPFASVVAGMTREPGRLIDLTYTVEQGKRLYVERIDIHGNIKTRDDVIRREFNFGEGDPYNPALVDRGERRLKALGYFKSVKIAEQPGSAPDRVVLDVALQEQQTGNFFISGGYSTTEGMLAQVSISDTNFFGTGDTAKASVTYGQYARGFNLAFSDPWFMGQRVGVGADVFANQTFANSNQAFNTLMYGAKFSTAAPLNENLGVSWNYSIYNQGLSLDPSLGTASLPIQQAAQAGSYWVSSIGNGVAYSTLDDPKNPTTGIRAQTNNEFAGLGGAANFAKTTEDVRLYHPIAGDLVGMVRAQGGYVTPWGGQQLPLLDGFFGGPQLVRGFAPYGFGPRDVTPGTTMDNLGGNTYWTTTAELQSPMPFVTPDAHLKVALFSDTGSLWATSASGISKLASLSPSQQIANSRALRASVGASLIWDSPFGALRVDYAYPVAKQSYDVTQRLQFTAGGF
ncbi:MAG TPA: outer membrane protein assembly factor BamA [Xanthobacteraceae bacterium]|nr:outer membrane protein assembly factor BamA [Xanthobacteraceae bacterium]